MVLYDSKMGVHYGVGERMSHLGFHVMWNQVSQPAPIRITRRGEFCVSACMMASSESKVKVGRRLWWRELILRSLASGFMYARKDGKDFGALGDTLVEQ